MTRKNANLVTFYGKFLNTKFSDEMAIFPNGGIWLERMQTS